MTQKNDMPDLSRYLERTPAELSQRIRRRIQLNRWRRRTDRAIHWLQELMLGGLPLLFLVTGLWLLYRHYF